MCGCLASAGYELAKSEETADIIVYNTCGVKGPTENRMINALKHLALEKKLVVAGCLPLINFERLNREIRFDGAVGPALGEKIVEIVRRVAEGKKIVDLESALNSKPELCLPRIRSNPVISVLPINYGCLGECAYCCVVNARGKLRSYPIESVIKQMRKDLSKGTREFWITSQDTAAYGRDIGTNLAELLEAINMLEGDFRVRVGMMTPNILLDILEQVVGAYRNERIYKFLHLPVQSGNDQLLKLMKRGYTADEFKKIVNHFKSEFPSMTLSTDVICGFPGETERFFEDTLNLIEEVKPDIVNVSKFFSRPKTAAAEMHNSLVKQSEIRRRSKATAILAKKIAFQRNQQWIGWSGEVLINEKGKISGTWIGRNYTYKPITISSNDNLLGETMRLKIVKAFTTHLSGIAF